MRMAIAITSRSAWSKLDVGLRKHQLAAVVLAFCLGSSASAFAAPTTTKDACISAFDRAQQHKRGGHLRDAREKLLICSQQECPAVVRADCADVLKQVDAAQPTIVLKAADAKGTDLTDVSVELNGAKLASTLDGRAVTVDPGKLALVFRRAPWDPVTVDVVVAEGEKGRIVRAILGPPAPAAEKPIPTTPVPPPSKPEERSLVGWAVPIGLGVVGVGALAIGGVTRLNLGSEVDDRKTGPNACAPSCTQADRASLSSDLVFANIMFGVGIGAIALGAVSWFVLAPTPSSSSSSSSTSPRTTATLKLLTGQPVSW